MRDEWPHDPDGDAGSEGMRKFGLAVIAKKVDETEDFPLERDAFLEAYGDEPVRINYQRVVSVADVFEYVEDAEFADKVEFNKAVGQALRDGDFLAYHPVVD